MTTEVEKQIVPYSVSDGYIAELQAKYAGITAVANYSLVREGIAELRGIRVAIEKKRVELKAESLEWGRKVDTEAKRLTTLLWEIEGPLKAAKEAVDAAKAAERQAKENAERARVEAELTAAREAEEAAAKAKRDAEEARLKAEREQLERERQELAAERAAEAARVKAERDAADAERQRILAEQHAELAKVRAKEREERERVAAEQARIAAEQKAERDRLAAEQAKLAEAQRIERERKERLERIEFERQARIRADAAAKEQARLDRLDDERQAMEQAERDRAEAARLEGLRPDVEKLARFAASIRLIVPPKVLSTDAETRLAAAMNELENAASSLIAWCKTFEPAGKPKRKRKAVEEAPAPVASDMF